MDTQIKGFLHYFVDFFISAGVGETNYSRAKPDVSENNRHSVVVFSLIAGIFLAIMLVLTFFNDGLKEDRLLYFISASLMGLILFLAAVPAKKSQTVTLVSMYLFMSSLLAFGILLGTVGSPHELTATFIALLLTVPQVFTDRPWRMCTMIGMAVIIFIMMALKFKDPVTWNSDIINAIVFGAVSAMASSWMMRMKVQRFTLEHTIRHMAETDMLTGLRNRNSYESRLSQAEILHTNAVYCVYVDVNGLHELNDTLGHEAGDRMLQYIATVMQNIFGADDTYRIGGDEYVAIGTDKPVERLEDMIRCFKQAVEAAGFHVAVGLEHRGKAELLMDEIVKCAEQKMYADKRDYYTRNGIDRRRKRN